MSLMEAAHETNLRKQKADISSELELQVKYNKSNLNLKMFS